jgi:hypothetical protein
VFVEGKGGTIRTGGRVAARLGKWAIEGAAEDWELTSELTWCNPVWFTSPGPYELRVSLTRGAWLWRDVRVTLLDEGRGGVSVSGKERWTRIE